MNFSGSEVKFAAHVFFVNPTLATLSVAPRSRNLCSFPSSSVLPLTARSRGCFSILSSAKHLCGRTGWPFAVLRPRRGLRGALRFAVGTEIRAVANKLGKTRQRSERRGSDLLSAAKSAQRQMRSGKTPDRRGPGRHHGSCSVSSLHILRMLSSCGVILAL